MLNAFHPSGKDELFTEARLQVRGEVQEELFTLAREARNRALGKKVFIRAVVEISNFCRQNCSYCGMRRDNQTLSRYRLGLEQLRNLLEDIPASVTDINFQAGEDPVAVREIVLPLISELRHRFGISVCLGTLNEKLYRELFSAGAQLYIIKLETGNAEHYRQIEAPGTLAQRLEAIRHLAATGWHVSSGFICGLPGQTREYLLETLQLLAELPLSGYSVSPFIPGADTLMAGQPPGDLELALNALALLRLAHPQHIIPAVSAFNILQANGYSRALQAGANLATINLTPDGWRENYLLYKRDRFIMNEQRVLDAIARAGCEPSRESLITALQVHHAVS